MQSAMKLRLRATTRHPHPHHHRGLLSPSRPFSTSSSRQNYASTLANLRIGSKTRVIFQGFTGRQATANAQESIEWGNNVVGGVTPGREGEHLGLPVLPSVRRAMEELKPDATGIYVPASQALAAIEEAIEAEVPLIVAVAEHVPLHDMLRIHAMLGTQSKSRLVGPNSPGIISAAEGERCRVGFQPLPCFSAGCVGIAAKSGTLSYEAVAATTRAGLGQSLCIGVGGDILPGTDLVEALQVLETDPNTKAIALIGEIGGDGEVLAAQWIRDYHMRTPTAERKPIVALVAGRYAPLDRVMGHAGAFWLPGEPDAKQKIQALSAVGATVVNHPSKIGDALKRRLEAAETGASQKETPELMEGASYSSLDDFAGAALGKSPQPQQQQTRGLHTSTRSFLTRARPTALSLLRSMQLQQTRSIHLGRDSSVRLLAEEKRCEWISIDKFPVRYIALGIDRATRSQCLTTAVILSPAGWRAPVNFNKILLPPGITDILSLGKDEWESVVATLQEQFKLKFPPFSNLMFNYRGALSAILANMATVFKEKEAKVVALELGTSVSHSKPFFVHDMRVELDDAAFTSGGRLEAVHRRYAGLERLDPGVVKAKEEGIGYHKLQPRDSSYNIGTLVNGAGLAMNVIDALWDAGGKAANFLDTGGKATSETVKKSFEIIQRDERVKVIFVNIFGGLTLGDMIARGIILAFQQTHIKVPVVVRIRGANEEEGQRIIAESGLPLYAFGDFDEAAAKAIELARLAKDAKSVHESESQQREEAAGQKDAIAAAAVKLEEQGEVEETNAPADDFTAETPALEVEKPEEVVKTES